MIRKIDETATDSWLQRAPVAVEPEVDRRVLTASTAHALVDRSQDGWDPMEVWLRYIDQPRRQRQRATPIDPRRRG